MTMTLDCRLGSVVRERQCSAMHVYVTNIFLVSQFTSMLGGVKLSIVAETESYDKY